MNLYQNIALKLPAFNELLDSLKHNNKASLVVGLSHIHKAHFTYSLASVLNEPFLVITEDEQTARRLTDDINAMHKNPLEQGGDDSQFAYLFPTKDFTFRSVDGVSREYEHIRLGVLSRVLNGECGVVIAPIEAVLQHTIPPSVLSEDTFTISADKSYNISELTSKLQKSGYVRRPQVDGIAQYSLRGGILDIYPSDSPYPVRIDFWGEDIDQMGYFDIESQRKTDPLSSIRIIPVVETLFESSEVLKDKIEKLIKKTKNPKAKECLNRDLSKISADIELNALDKYLPVAYETQCNLLGYFPKNKIIVNEISTIKERVKTILWQHHEDIKTLLEEGELVKDISIFYDEFAVVANELSRHQTVYLDTFAKSNVGESFQKLITINPLQNSGWGGELKLLSEDIKPLLHQSYAVVVLAGTPKAANNLANDLSAQGIKASYVTHNTDVVTGQVSVLSNAISSGFEYPDIKVSLITLLKHTAISKRKTRFKKGKVIQSLTDLEKGDAVVHVAHGIGIFEGIHKMELQGITKDYIKISYAGSDQLYIPVTQLDLVSKYIGPKEDKSLKLNKLNSTEWQKTKTRVKAAVNEMADELIRLYAERAKVKGYSFSPDTVWQNEFEERFEYQETGDQLRSIAEIKGDMEASTPMERLLCGDVGFGKTEVAVRAAFKCVMDSKQCALLCPTTILAWQHYQSITKRIGDFPINIELLSRFRTPKQIKETLKKLKKGEVDIIIGTHRLIQKDVEFKDLGLAIIDEEQRFGVSHKERFKEVFKSVDMLSISATPIPRTLNMALTGIRDMSTIEEAPQDRHPVQSYVVEHDYLIIAEAIRKELRRDGQLYYIHNRIETIELCASKISHFVPEAKIGIAHGKMDEKELSLIWRQLLEREIDILVCTTLIETGVDVPNCNTLIIEDADRMGLSQLYQLRGRIGRSNRRAFAYFTFRQGKVLSEIATKRLNAIREFTKFGSGFNIAMRDLEIRGAGNILGTRQHGHMEAVGYDMYLRLLNEAVSVKKGEAKPIASLECTIDIKSDAYIPQHYIDDTLQRIEVYRKIATIQSEEDVTDVLDELIDRFGDPPSSVKSLVDVALLRNTLAINGINEVTQQGSNLLLFSTSISMDVVKKIIEGLKKRVHVNSGKRSHIAVKLSEDNNPITTLREIVAILLEDNNANPQPSKNPKA